MTLALGLGLLATHGEKAKMGDWYYVYDTTTTSKARIEFAEGIYEVSHAGLMMRTSGVYGSYGSQILIYEGSKHNMDYDFSQLKEFFLHSGWLAYGRHLVARNFIMKGPCTLVGQTVNKLGATMTIKLAVLLRKLS